ncbi:MAG: hypothetical protein U0931_24415 [Vulcanimicrobiota bacterium]
MKQTLWTLAILAVAIWYSRREEKKKGPVRGPKQDGYHLLRVRGQYDEVMSALNPQYRDDKPPLPQDLDVASLKPYRFGCPHCGKMSIYGENLWHYEVLKANREPGDNTTTYVSRCKSCKGLMTSTVDHDD